MKKVPFSKLIIGLVLIAGIAFLCWCCYEMDRLDTLEPLSYIGTAVVTLMATALGFYVWRARQSDAYELAKKKLQEEKKLDGQIDVQSVIDEFSQYK